MAYVRASDVAQRATTEVRVDVEPQRSFVVHDGAGPQRFALDTPLGEPSLGVLRKPLGLGCARQFRLSPDWRCPVAGLEDASLVSQPDLGVAFGSGGGGPHMSGEIWADVARLLAPRW